MPPDRNWTGNSNLQVSLNQGNVPFDDASTTFDATTAFDGAPATNLINIYTPKNTTWTTPNPL